MKTLRKLTTVLLLTLVLGLPVFACAPPEPGQLETPPCQPAGSGDTSEPPSVSSIVPTADETVTEIATEVLKSLLSVF